MPRSWKARGAREPLPRLCAGPRHRINGEAVPLPRPRQGTPSPGTGGQARASRSARTPPPTPSKTPGADDGVPGFVGPPDEPALPFPRVDIIHANPDIADYVDASPLTAPKPLMVMSEIWAGSTPTTGLRRPTSTLCRTSGRTSTTHPMVP